MKAVTIEKRFCEQPIEILAIMIEFVKVEKKNSTLIRILFHEKPNSHTFSA